MALVWNEPKKPRPDPFDAAVGVTFTYEVHLANSTAKSDDEIQKDLEAAIVKALPLARDSVGKPTASGEPVENMLFLWDGVYGSLAIVCSDKSMMYDSSQVVKCCFLELEKESFDFPEETADQEWHNRSMSIKKMLSQILKNIDADELPVGIPILYSDQDRPSVGADHFKTVALIAE